MVRSLVAVGRGRREHYRIPSPQPGEGEAGGELPGLAVRIMEQAERHFGVGAASRAALGVGAASRAAPQKSLARLAGPTDSAIHDTTPQYRSGSARRTYHNRRSSSVSDIPGPARLAGPTDS